MSTAIYDSSLLTKIRQQKANYVFSKELAAVAATNPGIVRTIGGGQNGNPSQEVVVDVKMGCSACNAAQFVNSPLGNTRGGQCTCGSTTF